jgi:glycosyltransferase involved in cell wall biosynthesis
MKCISIVTCTLNSSAYLSEMIEAVLAQSVEPYEHIFVDGGSNDDTLEQISRYKCQVEYPVALVKAPAKGIANAMNVGAGQSSGDYLLFLHSDDKLHSPESLNLAAKAVSEGPVWIIGNCKYINEKSQIIGQGPVLPRSAENIYKENFVSHPSTFIARKDFLDLGGFDESYKVAMDYELWLRLISRDILPKQSKEIFSEFRIHQGGMSTSGRRQMIAEDLRARLRYVPDVWSKFRAISVYAVESLYLTFPWAQKPLSDFISMAKREKSK